MRKIYPIGLISLIGIINFFYLVPPVVNWDEGAHALLGFRVWLALKDANLSYFLDLMRTQFAYPPLGSLILALINLPFEFSMNLTRFASTLGFIVGGILMWKIAKQLTKHVETQNLASLPALFLFLTSPVILFYSVTVFKESWGLALTLLTIYLYFKKSYFLVGLSLILLFLEKYNYAMLLVFSLMVETFIDSVLILIQIKVINPFKFPQKFVRVKIIKRNLMIFLPLFLFAVWWIYFPDNKSQWFMDIMRSDWNPVTVGVGSSLEYLLFYVNSIRTSYVFSELLFYLLLTGYLLAAFDLGERKIRFLFVFFTLNIILGTVHSINLQDRYIYTSVPALFLLVGYEIKKVLRYQSIKVLMGVLLILVVKDIIFFPQLLKSNASHMLLSAMYNEADYRDTLFDFNRNNWPQKPSNTDSSETVIDYILANSDASKPMELVGFTSEISPDWLELRSHIARLRHATRDKRNYSRYIVTIEVKPTSRLYTYDYRRANLWQLSKVKEMEKQYYNNIISQKEFKELGVIVKIYGF